MTLFWLFTAKNFPTQIPLKRTCSHKQTSAICSILPSPKWASAVTKNTVSIFLLGNYVFLQLYSMDQKSLASEKELSDFLDSLQENLPWPGTVITTKDSVKLKIPWAMNTGCTWPMSTGCTKSDQAFTHLRYSFGALTALWRVFLPAVINNSE